MKLKIEFLNKLFNLLSCRTIILEWLKSERIITDDIMQRLLGEHHTQHAVKMATLFEELKKAEKLQLLEYEWTLMPREYMRLTIITDSAKREWEYTV